MHLVCPPTPIAARQRCGGACREELGDPWVAFFLMFTQQPLEIVVLGKDQVNRGAVRAGVLCRLTHAQPNERVQ